MKFVYLASPYSHPDKEEVNVRVEQTSQCFAMLALQGHAAVFSPILHCHDTAQNWEMPTDAAHWEAYNTCFVRRCDEMYVLTIDGWKESLGVTQEISLALQLGIPVRLIDRLGRFLETLEPNKG